MFRVRYVWDVECGMWDVDFEEMECSRCGMF